MVECVLVEWLCVVVECVLVEGLCVLVECVLVEWSPAKELMVLAGAVLWGCSSAGSAGFVE